MKIDKVAYMNDHWSELPQTCGLTFILTRQRGSIQSNNFVDQWGRRHMKVLLWFDSTMPCILLAGHIGKSLFFPLPLGEQLSVLLIEPAALFETVVLRLHC